MSDYEANQERYFVESLYGCAEVEQIIKQKKVNNVFQVIVKNSSHIKRFTWFLLKHDISYERKPMGSGITAFFVDITVPFFMKKK